MLDYSLDDDMILFLLFCIRMTIGLDCKVLKPLVTLLKVR